MKNCHFSSKLLKVPQSTFFDYNKANAQKSALVIAILEAFFFVSLIALFKNPYGKYKINLILYIVTFVLSLLFYLVLKYSKLTKKTISVLSLFFMFYMIGYGLAISTMDFLRGGHITVLLSIILGLVGCFIFNPIFIFCTLTFVCGLTLFLLEYFDWIGMGFVLNVSVFFILAFINAYTKTTFYVNCKKANKELEHFSHHDYLTKAKNRKGLDEDCLKLVGKEVLIILLDIDNFKTLNDKSGHLGGDEVLKKVAFLLFDIFSIDCVYRFGGDEFLIITPEVDITWKYKLNSGIALSGGYAVDTMSQDYASVINKVDKLLYKAKQQGKNQIIDK